MPQKKKFNRRVPPYPGDPKDYVLVKGKNRYYWRLKRGTLKPAVLNDSLKRSAAITSTTNRAAKQMMSLLSVFTQQMELGDAITLVAGAFKRAYLKDRMDFRFIHEIDFQKNYLIRKLFTGPVSITMEEGRINVKAGVGTLHVKQLSPVAVGYRVTAILVHGDPAKDNGLKIETDESEWYSFEEKKESFNCNLSLKPPPKSKPWMVMIHITCKMRDKLPAGPRYHRMWVEKAG